MSSGYRDCSCAMCFGIAIGEYDGSIALCHSCEDAGCDGEGDCQVPPENEDE